MDLFRNLVILVLTILVLTNDESKSAEAAGVFTFIHDLLQNNVAGAPIVHEKTQWEFDPELGKKRRVRYEEENGRRGEIAIEKIGMGIGYKGPWGTPA